MKAKFYTIALVIASTQAMTAFDSCSLFNESEKASKYQFIEKKFITDIASAKDATWSKVLMIIPGSIATASGLEYGHQTENTPKDDLFFKNLLTKKFVNGVICVSSIAIIAGVTFQHHLSAHANQDAVRDFFTHWDKNQFYTPDELFESFEAIACNIEDQGEAFIKNHANEIVKTIQFIVTRYFEKRYEKLLQIKAHSALGEIKTVSETLQNFISGAKYLAE